MGTRNREKSCIHVKSDGARCRANPSTGSPYCFFHDPRQAQARAAARRAGGIERTRKPATPPADTADRPVTNAADIFGLMAKTINEVRHGQLQPKAGYVIGYLASVALKASEQSALEARLAQLEAVVKTQPTDIGLDPEIGTEQFTFEFVNREAEVSDHEQQRQQAAHERGRDASDS
jgi:hypothetical protein